MKNKILHILFAVTLLLGSVMETSAQYSSDIFIVDRGIYDIRMSTIPDFRYRYDDYLQYSPAALMIGLKALGYESRSSWGRMMVSSAFSTASVATFVNSIKYSVKRLRPDNSRHNSFPSGHTATAFMAATLLHKEYGWRSPWFSIGGYTAAALTGVSRIMNNKHWATDVLGGAIVGIGATHLGYLLTDLIYKEKGLNSSYYESDFFYDPEVRHYAAELMLGQRYMLGDGSKSAFIGVAGDIGIAEGAGLSARAIVSSRAMEPLYNFSIGGHWNYCFSKRLELQPHALAGYAVAEGQGGKRLTGVSLTAGAGLSMITDNNFKIKAFADYETMGFRDISTRDQSIMLGFSAAWFW
jgi:hypothetical protein